MKTAIQLTLFSTLLLAVACAPAGGNRRGHEFMPDMVHSTAYEANLYDYYSFNRWGGKEEYKKYTTPRTSVPGTVARGELVMAYAANEADLLSAESRFSGVGTGSFAYTPNGHVPYYYGNTEDERIRATREITRNPFPITDQALAHGKEMYTIYCGICHGDKGDGLGYLVREADPAKGITAGVYPAAPANFMLDTFVNASVGRFYHGIMYGKNVMGSYADKLSYEERWEVIHYIRSLQAANRKKVYSPAANTLNNEAQTWAAVESTLPKPAPAAIDTMPAHPAETQEANHH